MEILRLWKILLRRRKLFLLIALPIIILPTLVSFFMPRVYKQSTKMWISTQDIQPQYLSNLPSSFGKLSYYDNENIIDTLAVLLESAPVIDSVIKKHGLKDGGGRFLDVDDLTQASVLKKYFTQRLAAEVERIEDSEVLRVSAYSADPAQAAELSNSIAQEFKSLFASLGRQGALAAVAFIDSELAKAREAYTSIEQEKLAFKHKNLLFDIDTQKSNLLSQYKEYSTSIEETDRKKAESRIVLSATLEGLKKQPEFKLSTTNFQANPVILSALTKIFELEIEISGKLVDYQEAHPDIISRRKNQETAKETIRKEVQKTFSSEVMARNSYFDSLLQQYGETEIEMSTLDARKTILVEQNKKIEVALKDLSTKEMEYAEITLRGEDVKTMVNTLMSKLDMAKIASEMDVTNAIVIEDAALPNNIKNSVAFPKRKIILFASFFAAIAMGVFAVLFQEYIDDTVRTYEDLAGVIDRSLVFTLPGRLSDEGAHGTSPELTGKVNDILTMVSVNNAGKSPTVLTVTSFTESEGKTAMACHLAAAAARTGLKVLAVEADESGAGIERFLGAASPSTQGSGTLMVKADGVDIVRAGSIKAASGGAGVREFIEEQKANYDLILINSTPLSIGLNNVMYSIFSDGFLIMLKPGSNRVSDVETSLERFGKSGARLLAAVFNG